MGNRQYSSSEIELLKKHGHDKTDEQLRKLLLKELGIKRTRSAIGKQRLKHDIKRSNHGLYSMVETCEILDVSATTLNRILLKYKCDLVTVGRFRYLSDKQISFLEKKYSTIPVGYIPIGEFADIVGLCSGTIRKQLVKGKMVELVFKKGNRYFVPRTLVEKYNEYMKKPTVYGKLPLRTDWNKFFDFINLV